MMDPQETQKSSLSRKVIWLDLTVSGGEDELKKGQNGITTKAVNTGFCFKTIGYKD